MAFSVEFYSNVNAFKCYILYGMFSGNKRKLELKQPVQAKF